VLQQKFATTKGKYRRNIHSRRRGSSNQLVLGAFQRKATIDNGLWSISKWDIPTVWKSTKKEMAFKPFFNAIIILCCIFDDDRGLHSHEIWYYFDAKKRRHKSS